MSLPGRWKTHARAERTRMRACAESTKHSMLCLCKMPKMHSTKIIVVVGLISTTVTVVRLSPETDHLERELDAKIIATSLAADRWQQARPRWQNGTVLHTIDMDTWPVHISAFLHNNSIFYGLVFQVRSRSIGGWDRRDILMSVLVTWYIWCPTKPTNNMWWEEYREIRCHDQVDDLAEASKQTKWAC